MSKFPHLKFREKLTGTPRLGTNPNKNSRTVENKKNRKSHSVKLGNEANLVYKAWFAHVEKREALGLAPLDPSIQPIYLEINPSLLDSNLEADLLSFGIEIISQEDDGFILGASLDNLQSLKDKIDDFAKEEHGSAKIADFYKIITGDHSAWKPKAILSDTLLRKWQDIPDDEFIELEVSIAFGIPVPKKQDQNKKHGLASRNVKYDKACLDRSDKQEEREAHFRKFIEAYGKISSSIVDLEDSLGCEVIIKGKGLKDLIINYPFVFDVKEKDEITGGDTEDDNAQEIEFDTISPDPSSPSIGVIDSGIMEQHKFLNKAVDSASSSYVIGDTNIEDKVINGGHGTRVAGAVLYPLGISNYSSPYQLPFRIRNIRVLNAQNRLLNLFPAKLMKDIVDNNDDIRIFNLSINSRAPYRLKHMSTWAAMLDKLIYEKNVLFVNSVGNIDPKNIRFDIMRGNGYPEYLKLPYHRAANPSQSSFSIVVGSVNHLDFDNPNTRSLGLRNEISAFSRIGQGIWSHVKPDVVEYGGGLQISKNGLNSISNKDTSIELLRSNQNGGPANGKDIVGTSYSAPKVSHIIGHLAELYPEANVNLWRALLVQGAKLPNDHFQNPSVISLRHYGYGIPSLKNVTENNEHRVTFYVDDKIKTKEGKIYSVSIPDAMREAGDEFDILIEATLAYTAKTRRTRQKTKSYVGTWLDWDNSKLGEPYEEFKSYTLRSINGNETSYDSNKRSSYDTLRWKLGKASNQGVDGHRRNDSTLQKDYCIIKSFELPKELSFAIHAHNGWDKNNDEVPFAFAVSIEVLGQDIPIYHEVRVENEIEISV